jgi:hypothetical protein
MRWVFLALYSTIYSPWMTKMGMNMTLPLHPMKCTYPTLSSNTMALLFTGRMEKKNSLCIIDYLKLLVSAKQFSWVVTILGPLHHWRDV